MRNRTRPAQRMALAALTIGGLLAFDAADAAQDSDAPSARRVRSGDRAIARLLDRGARESRTFQRLLAAIDATNGMVHVEYGKCGGGAKACLPTWMHTSGSTRFLRVLVDPALVPSEQDQIALVAHELQHAVEALSDPAVANSAMLYNFLKRNAPTNGTQFETAEAIRAGEDVLDELRRPRTTTRR